MGVCDRNCVILQTKRARDTLNKKILDLLYEKAFLEHEVVELVYKFDQKTTASVNKGESIT